MYCWRDCLVLVLARISGAPIARVDGLLRRWRR
jgi:hypothetical protein